MKNDNRRGNDRRYENQGDRQGRNQGYRGNGDRRGEGRYEGGRGSYGDSRRDESKRYGGQDGKRYDDRKNDRGRRPYGENRFDGPGRRTYGDERSSGPRVGRVYSDVPAAQRVDGDAPQPRRVTGDYRPPRREDIVERDFGNRRGELHRGNAWRSESGPRGYRREDVDYEAPEIPEALAQEFTDASPEDEHILAGRNPIREALKAGRPMEKLLVASGELSGTGREIVKLAKEAGVVVQQVDRSRLDQIYPAHQGMLAYVAAVPYTPLEDIIASAKAKGEDPFVILLDGVTDPHNLGAIIRSAECAGAHGVVLPERRAAGLSPAAAKAAAGALNHMPVARVKNLNRAIEELKAAGVWITGTAMDGEDAFAADLTGPIALVIGSEGDGVSRLTLEKCDRTVSLPMKGKIESLNASVAAGILMYEVLRQRRS